MKQDNLKDVFEKLEIMGREFGLPTMLIKPKLDEMFRVLKEKEIEKGLDDDNKIPVDFKTVLSELFKDIKFPNQGTVPGKEEYKGVQFLTNEDSLFILIDLPGFNSKEDIKINIRSDETSYKKLIISGKRVLDSKFAEYNQSGFPQGYFDEFTKLINLPENTDLKSISANYNNGVLEISLNKISEEVTEIKIN